MPNCWIEVDLAAITANYHSVQELVGENATVMAVVKANAYGHGAVEVSRALSQAGAQYLAVTRLEEAIPIRAAGILTPILLLAPALPDEVHELIPYRLTACISSLEDAERLSETAVRQGAVVRAQLKVNTGMSRFGVEPEEAVDVAKKITALPNLEIEAAWTHFAFAAGEARDTTKVHQQFSFFQPLIRKISQAIQIPPHGFHCANSATILRFPSMRLTCVRAGTLLYGQMPSVLTSEAAVQQRFVLENTFQAKARVLAVRNVRPGQSVGYGGEWSSSRPARIATIGIGFADGFSQEPQTRCEPPYRALRRTARQAAIHMAQWTGLKGGSPARTVSIRNQRAPIVGRIAMQSCAVDVSKIEGVQVGDEVLVSLRRTSAGAHLPRIHKDLS